MSTDVRNRRRRVSVIAVPVLLVLVAFYSLTYGSVPLSLSQIWAVFVSQGDPLSVKIMMNLRLPRLLVGLLVGACLAASGALLQGAMKNPLSDPGVIGVSAGGGLAAVLTMIVFPELGYLLPVTAFAGTLLTAVAIYMLAWDQGASPLKIILSGVAVNALLGAFMSGIMVIFSDRVQAVLPWLSGGLSGRSWSHFAFMAPYAAVGLVLALGLTKSANLLLLGDETAVLLGQKVERRRFVIIAVSALLAGTAVSVAGLVSFVGLVVPHAFRLLVGNDYRYLLPLSMVGGAALVAFADTAARSWFDPIELPVGILLAALGAPFFLYLVKKRRLM